VVEDGGEVFLAVISGQWAEGSGQWAVGSGQWPVVSGQFSDVEAESTVNGGYALRRRQ
jgi:hypothetical protein